MNRMSDLKNDKKTLMVISEIEKLRPEDALKKLENVLKNQPKNEKFLAEKGHVLLTLDKEKEALKIFDKLLKTDPTSAAGWLGYGVHYNDNGKFDKAIEALDHALKSEPGNSDVLEQKAFSLLLKNKIDESQSFCDLSLKLDPRNVGALVVKSMIFDSLKKYDRSLESAQKAINVNPNYEMGWYCKGQALYQLGKLKDASYAYEKALEIDPKDADTWHELGLIFLERSEFSKAIKSFQNEIKFSRTGLPWRHIAEAYEKQGNFQKAIECYDIGLKSMPNSVEILEDKAVLLTKLDKDEKAIKIYNKIQHLEFEENPAALLERPALQNYTVRNNKANLSYNKAISLKKLGRYEEALETIEEGFDSIPYNLGLLNEKLDILSINENYLEGLALVNRFIKLNEIPEYEDPEELADLYNKKGRFLGSLKRYAEAIEALDAGLEIEPDDIDLLSGKAIALSYIENYNECLKIIKRLQEIDSKNPQNFIFEGNLLIEKNKFEDALKCYYKAEKLERDNEDAMLQISSTLIVLKEYKRSLIYSNKLLKNDPKSALYLSQKGLALVLSGDLKKGQKIIEKSISIDPNQGFSWFCRAVTLLNSEKIDEAVGDLKVALYQNVRVLKWLKIFGYDKKLNQAKQWTDFLKLAKGVNS